MNLIIVAAVIFIALMCIVNFRSYRAYCQDGTGFLLSNRDASTFDLSMSIAASWIYAFGVIMVGFFAYTKGLGGWFWFVMPQLLLLLMMAMLSYWLIRRFPHGFTITSFIQERYHHTPTTTVFQVVILLAIMNALIGNLTGFGLIAEYVTGGNIGYNTIVTVLGVTVTLYSMLGGLRSSIRTDILQMIIMLTVSITGIVLAILNWDLVADKTMSHGSPVWNLDVMLAPGLLLLILLSGSAINDNGFYQRIFACKDKTRIHIAFMWSAVIFMVTMVGLGLLAIMTLAQDITVTNPRLSVTMGLEHALGSTGIVLITLAVLAAAASTMDTALNSFGSIIAKDFLSTRDAVTVSRVSILVLGLISMLVAYLKIDIWIIFVTFGMLRLVTVFPMIAAIGTDRDFRMPIVLLSMLCAFVFAVMAHVKIIEIPQVWAALFTVLIPLVGLLLSSKRRTA